MADGAARMVFLGFGKYARADKIYALEPIRGEDRGGGKRTLVWVDGISEPITHYSAPPHGEELRPVLIFIRTGFGACR